MENNPYGKAIEETVGQLSQNATAPREQDGGWSWSTGLSLIALLAAVGFMVFLSRWLRRLPLVGGGRGREMQVLDRLPLTRQSSLLIVRVRGRDYWLAEHAHGVSLLSGLPQAAGGGATGGGTAGGNESSEVRKNQKQTVPASETPGFTEPAASRQTTDGL